MTLQVLRGFPATGVAACSNSKLDFERVRAIVPHVGTQMPFRSKRLARGRAVLPTAISQQIPTAVNQQIPLVFEPRFEPTLLIQQGVVLITIMGIGAYWWFVLVPSERTSVARSKRRGTLDKYLEAIENDPDKKLERWFHTDWLNQRQDRFKSRSTRVHDTKPSDPSPTVSREEPEDQS